MMQDKVCILMRLHSFPVLLTNCISPRLPKKFLLLSRSPCTNWLVLIIINDMSWIVFLFHHHHHSHNQFITLPPYQIYHHRHYYQASSIVKTVRQYHYHHHTRVETFINHMIFSSNNHILCSMYVLMYVCICFVLAHLCWRYGTPYFVQIPHHHHK